MKPDYRTIFSECHWMTYYAWKRQAEEKNRAGINPAPSNSIKLGGIYRVSDTKIVKIPKS